MQQVWQVMVQCNGAVQLAGTTATIAWMFYMTHHVTQPPPWSVWYCMVQLDSGLRLHPTRSIGMDTVLVVVVLIDERWRKLSDLRMGGGGGLIGGKA